MRRLSSLALTTLCACSSGGSTAVENSTLTEGGAAPVVTAPQQDTEQCAAGVTMCLYGTARTSGYTGSPTAIRASLYRVFPLAATGVGTDAGAGAPVPLAAQTVARDGTWAFSSDQAGNPLDAWGHYYVEFVPAFSGTRGGPGASTRVGPLALPGDGAGPIAVQVKPVQLDVLEEAAVGQPLALEWATAHVFDPATGDEIQSGASVSIVVGGAATPMTWGTIARGELGYFVQFTTPPPAAPGYVITTSPPGAAMPSSWQLVANPATIAAAIASPSASAPAPVAAGQNLHVTWPVQADADYEIVQLFQAVPGSNNRFQPQPVYSSPTLDPADVNNEIIPGSDLAAPGAYLLNVAFNRANCPATADGCVITSFVANEVLTAH